MDFTLKGNGPNSEIPVQIEPNYQAARISPRPVDYQVTEGGALGGHYSLGMMTGLMAAGIASAAEVFQIRWAVDSKFFILKKMIVQFSTATGFAATTLGAPVELILGHGSTVNGSGGSAWSPNSVGNRMRSAMAPTAFASGGNIRISTTAALTAATNQTLEPSAIASCMGADNRTLVSTPPFPLFDLEAQGDHGCVLANGDTAVIRTVSPAATGTWYMSVALSWMELASY